MYEYYEGTDAEQEHIEASQIFDLYGNELMSAGELNHVWLHWGKTLTDEVVGEAISAADVDGDGQTKYEEFALQRGLDGDEG